MNCITDEVLANVAAKTMLEYPQGTEARVCEDIARRQEFGFAKYRISVSDNPLQAAQWARHAYEEALDQAIYLRRLVEELERSCDGGKPHLGGGHA